MRSLESSETPVPI